MIYYSIKNDKTYEPLGKVDFTSSRLIAAKYFAAKKNLTLKQFLNIFMVNKYHESVIENW